jgi:hypothetical protein
MTPDADPPSLLERRLDEHLELLRTESLQPPGTLVRHIVHTARWQRAIRQPLLAVAGLASAVSDGVRLLFGSRSRRR